MTDEAVFAFALEQLKESWATYPILERVKHPDYDRSLGSAVCALMFAKCGGDEAAFRRALEDFVALSEEFVVLQMELDKTGHYRYSSFDEVRALVYDNPETMDRRYLNGLFLSSAFWVNHTKILRYFIDAFCVGQAPSGHVLEVPSGTGIFISEFARRNPGWEARGIDISESSVRFGRALAHVNGAAGVAFSQTDVFDLPGSFKYDRIICGELLEHLEDPIGLLRKLREIIAPGGKLFLTTAIWAASIDHIYLYSSTQEARDQLERFFHIESELALNVREGRGPEDPKTPINYACVLTPA